MSDHTHVLPALTLEDFKIRWTSKPVTTFPIREKSLVLQGIEPRSFSLRVCSLITIPTELCGSEISTANRSDLNVASEIFLEVINCYGGAQRWR